MTSCAQLQREADATRVSLADTLGQLRDGVAPSALSGEAVALLKDTGLSLLKGLADQARANPVPALLIGAGLTMMLTRTSGGDVMGVAKAAFASAAATGADAARSAASTVAGAASSAAGTATAAVKDAASSAAKTVTRSAVLLRSTVISCTRGGDFLYHLPEKKRQELRRGHNTEFELGSCWKSDSLLPGRHPKEMRKTRGDTRFGAL